jgi:hypothetical protein
MPVVKLSGAMLGGRIYKTWSRPRASENGGSRVSVTSVMTAGLGSILLLEGGISADKKVQNSHKF